MPSVSISCLSFYPSNSVLQVHSFFLKKNVKDASLSLNTKQNYGDIIQPLYTRLRTSYQRVPLVGRSEKWSLNSLQTSLTRYFLKKRKEMKRPQGTILKISRNIYLFWLHLHFLSFNFQWKVSSLIWYLFKDDCGIANLKEPHSLIKTMQWLGLTFACWSATIHSSTWELLIWSSSTPEIFKLGSCGLQLPDLRSTPYVDCEAWVGLILRGTLWKNTYNKISIRILDGYRLCEATMAKLR